jgi:uncharacterized protein with NRDE domain
MCLIAISYRERQDLPLALISYRDEFYARPSKKAHFWPEIPNLFAGKDLQGGGTWMGVTRSGRIAALTNFRQGFYENSKAPSRGGLVQDFLTSDQTPEEWLAQLETRKSLYNGFNIFVSDGRQLAYLSNREESWRLLGPGLYGLSNAFLDSNWPKVQAAKTALQTHLEQLSEGTKKVEGTLLQEWLLKNAEPFPDEQLPDTGVGYDWEKVLSTCFIQSERYRYGTRACTALTISSAGETTFHEDCLSGSTWNASTEKFQLSSTSYWQKGG